MSISIAALIGLASIAQTTSTVTSSVSSVRTAEESPRVGKPDRSNVSPLGATQLESSDVLPSGLADYERTIIARFDVEIAPIFGSFSGDPNTANVPVSSSNLRASSTYLEGALAIGTRGLFYKTFNTYALGVSGIDLRGAPAIDPPLEGTGPRPAAQPSIYDSFPNARAFLLQLAYGELEGLTADGALSHVVIRAGRQSHFNIVAVNFDGATAGYDDQKLQLVARVGQRAAVFDRLDGSPGFLAGGNAGYTLALADDAQLRFSAEYLHFSRELTLLARDLRVTGGAQTAELRSDIAQIGAAYETSSLLVHALLSYLDPEISHVRANVEWSSGPLTLIANFDQKLGRELIFDLASAGGLIRDDLRLTYETLRLNVPDRQRYTELSASVGYQALDWLEIVALPVVHVVSGTEETRTAYDVSFVEAGVAAYGRFPLTHDSGLETTIGYDGLFYLRDTENETEFRQLGGENVVHELDVSVRYAQGDRFIRGRMLGSRRLTVGLGGFARTSQLEMRIGGGSLSEGTYGGRADATWKVSRYFSVRGAYEYALDSNLFAPQLAAFHQVRAGIEGRF